MPSLTQIPPPVSTLNPKLYSQVPLDIDQQCDYGIPIENYKPSPFPGGNRVGRKMKLGVRRDKVVGTVKELDFSFDGQN